MIHSHQPYRVHRGAIAHDRKELVLIGVVVWNLKNVYNRFIIEGVRAWRRYRVAPRLRLWTILTTNHLSPFKCASGTRVAFIITAMTALGL